MKQDSQDKDSGFQIPMRFAEWPGNLFLEPSSLRVPISTPLLGAEGGGNTVCKAP